jgi:hypothetical protein
MAEAFINPVLLNWARRRHHLTIEAAAQKPSVTPGAWETWEKAGTSNDRKDRNREEATHTLWISVSFKSTRGEFSA